jgi:hypothetical protein
MADPTIVCAVPRTLTGDDRVEFSVCYEVLGETFWDNGPDGRNYIAHVAFGSPLCGAHEYHRTMFRFDPDTVKRWSACT